MEFKLHPNPEMGLYIQNDPIFGDVEWAFPLTDDERSNAYREWRNNLEN
jgi:hypothetical protein